MKNQKGFSLVELLVVVIIVAIVAAIAIPNLLASRRAANEASAIASMRSISSAQAVYFSTTGGNTIYAPDLLALGTANLLDDVLGSALGEKSGYTFTTTAGATGTNLFCADAVPVTSGTTGTRTFSTGPDGVIYGYPGAGSAAACAAAGVFVPGAGVAIQ